MKKSIKKIIAAAIAVLGISSLAGGAACAIKSTQVAAPVNTEITKTAAPTDGSLPTAHSGTENLAYIARVLDEQSQFHVYTYTLTNAAIATQITRGYRDYKDGVLISTDITYSSMVKSGAQTCTVFNESKGEYEVYFRASAEPESTTTATTAQWSTDAPLYYTKNAYYHTYGLLQNELTNFILNDDSVLESGEVHANPDGTYTQSFVLDPVISTYYYAYGMKTRGGLSGFPAFQSVTMSVTFTDKWLPLTVTMRDVSTVNKGVVVTSTSDSTCEFTYDGVDSEHYGYYDGYFKQYLGADGLEQGGDYDEEFVIDVTNVLSNGFAKIMDGGAQFDIELDLNGNKYRGFVFIALDLSDPLETLELRLSLGKTLHEQGFYVEYKNGEANAYYGDGFALEVNIAELKPRVAEIIDWAEELAKALNITSSGGDGGLSIDGDALSELLNAMSLEQNGSSVTLSLASDNLLGLGVGLDAKLLFGVEAKTVTFRGGVIGGLSVGGEPLDIKLVLRSTTADIISRDKSQTAANLSDYVADAFALISSDLIKVEVVLDGNSEKVNVSALKGLSASVTAFVDIDGVTVGAEAAVSYNFNGNDLSAVMDIWYGYDVQSAGYGRAILSLKEINGTPVSVVVGCDIQDLVQAIKTLLAYGGAPSGIALDSVVGMINSALSNDFSSLISEVYADNLQIKLGVNVDTVLTMLGVDAGVKFGSCALVYTRGEGIHGGELSAALPAIGFTIGISGADGEIEQPDTSNCLDLVYLVEDIQAFLQADLYEINLSFDGNATEQVKGLKANATVYADINGLAVYAKLSVSYKYKNNAVSAELRAWYEYDSATNGKIVLALDSLNGVEVNVRVSAEINKTVEAVKELLNYCNVQLNTPEIKTDINLEEVITSVLNADLSELIPELATSKDGIKLGVNAEEALKLFKVELPVTVGIVNLAYSHKNCNLTASVPAMGISVAINALNGEIEQPDTSDCLDLVYLVEDIQAFLQADLYEVNLSFDGNAIEQVKGLKANATVYADIKGLAVYAKVSVSYEYKNGTVSAELRAWYDYGSATNGTVILSLDKLNGIETGVRISADINKTVEAVKELLNYCNVQLNTPEIKTDIDLEEIITSVLNADLSELIPELSTSKDGIKLGVNAEEVLKLFKVELPVTVGIVNLAYSHKDCSLTANVPALGLGVTVNCKQGEIQQPDTSNCLDLVYLVEDIQAFLQADLYEVNLSFDGNAIEQVKGLKANATVYADIKGLAVYAKVSVSYEYKNGTVSAELRAWYDYDSATNGKIVLALDSLNGVEVNVRVSAEINETVEAVKELLNYCKVQLNTPEVNTDIYLEEVITSVLNADLSELIPELSTGKDGIKLGVNAEEVLKLFNVELPVTVGVVNLAYSHKNCNLTANVPALGLGVTVNCKQGEIEQPDTSDCLDLVYLVEDIQAFLQADLYEINLSFDGNAIEQVKGLKANATVYADINGLAVYAKVSVSYKYKNNTVSAELRAWYDYDSATNGTVILSLDKLNGIETGVRISAEINKTVEAVKELLNYCNVQLNTPEINTDIDLEEIITSVLNADLSELIPELSTSKDGIKLGVNAEEVLKLFKVELPVTVGIVNLAYSHKNCNLTASVPAMGISIAINALNGEIEQNDTSDCLDLVYLVEDIQEFLQADLYEVNLDFDGNAIEQVKGLKVNATVYADIKGLAVYAKVSVSYEYKNNAVSAELRAWYDYGSATNGTVILSLDKLNGIETGVRISAEINETAEAVKELLNYCNVQLNTPEIKTDINLEEIITSVLNADLSELIPELSTSKDGIKLGVNAEEVLKLFKVELPVTVGVVNLAYSHKDSNLTANVPAMGISVAINALNGEIEQPDTSNCLDLVYLVEDIQAFLQADLYEVNISFDGNAIEQVKGLKANATVYADINGFAVYAKVSVSYEYKNGTVSAELRAWYDYDSETNGTVILSLDKLNGIETGVRISAEINKTVEAVKELLNYCNVQLNTPEVKTDIDLDEIITSVLNADLSELIPELSTNKDGIKLGVNAEKVLKLFKVELPVTVGIVNLAYSHKNRNLTASVPALGLGVTVNCKQGEIEQPDTSDCLDLVYLVEDIQEFLQADLYEVNLSFDGNAIEQVKGLKANATVYADINGLAVYAKVSVSYKYKNNAVSAELRAWYDYESATNGTVILSLDKLNGIETGVRISAEINKTAEAVKELLNYCNVQLNTPEIKTDIDLDEIITSVLNADLSTLIPELSTSKDGIKLGVNAEEALKLFKVELPVTVGVVNLAYSHKNCNLTASVPAMGISIAINALNGEIEQPDTSNCLDLVYLVEDIQAFLQADLYEVNLSFDGNATEQVKGLKANATVYADIKGLAVYAKLSVSYKYKNNAVSAELRAWYDYDSATNGTVILSLDKLNGIETGVRISAEINKTVEAVKELLNYCNVQLNTPEIKTDINLEEIITSVLNADLSELIPELSTSKDGIKLGVNAEEVLKLFKVELPVTVGVVNLAYSHKDCNLTANVPAMGISVAINALNGEIEQKPQNDVLDLAALVELVNSAIEQVNGIIENQSVSFEIVNGTTYLYLDGLTVNLWGKGEISWKEGNEYVALDLGISLAESGLDATHLKVLYRKNAQGKPVVRLAINEAGIDIYDEDIQTVIDGFKSIYEKIASAFGLKIDSPSSDSADKTQSGNKSGLDFSSLTSNDKLMTLVFGMLSSGSWVDILNDMTLSVDSRVIEKDGVQIIKRSLLLTYAADNAAKVCVSTDGNIALFYDVNTKNGFAFGGEIRAGAASGALVKSLDSQFNSMNTSSSREDGSAVFVKLAYDYLFDAISSISVKDILGSDTYTVTFNIAGDNCNISALEGVLVDAKIYVTGSSDGGKLAEADLDIDVAGVKISLNVITERMGGQTCFYIDLRQVLNFKLPDLKVMATQSSLYDTIETLISIVSDTNVLDFVGKFIGAGGEEEQAALTAAEDKGAEGKKDAAAAIADVLEKILNFNFGEAVVSTRVGDETTAVFDLDNFARQFGLQCEPLGTVELNINHKYHSMKTSAKAPVADSYGNVELKEWIWLSSVKAEARDYSKLDKTKYISIEFIPDLLKDAIKFATDDGGDIYNMFTLGGTVSVNLVKIVNIELNITTLTIGFGEKTGFYLSLIANLSGGMVSDNTIGLTYQNGYLTLGRNLSSANPEYKIMTFEYFVDNLFAKGSSSTLNWLLGISNTLWNTVVGLMGDLVNMDSGLTSPEDIYLYKAQESKAEQEVSLYDYVNALRVVIGGRTSADFGDVSAIESTLGVYDDYYGFDLNASLITDGVLTKLYAAITRSDEVGITGIRAYGAIQSYVTFSASLDYKEGLTEENYYKIGNPLTEGVTAPSLYDEALAKAEKAGVAVDFDHFVKVPEKGYDEIFGCFSTADMSYGYSRVLYSHKLTVVRLDGSVEERDVRHGSTVYLYDNSFPVYTDEGKTARVVYSLEEGGAVYGKTITANGDITLYQITRKAVNVIIANGAAEEIITSFAGDFVPTGVDGLDTIDGPYYEDGSPVLTGDIIPENISVLRLRGVFVQSEVIVNYVKYSFDAESRSYIASGKAAGFADTYSVQGETLVLENEINGYEVTAIAAGAFANTDEKPVKKVVVAPNITKIGTNAFMGNVEMQTVVFLADSVYFEGSDGDGTFAFYGCSTGGDSEKTNLEIYYNFADCASHDLTWTHFSTKSVIGIKYYKYIGTDPNTAEWIDYHANGGGKLHAAGSWSMLDVVLTGAELIEEINFASEVDARIESGFNGEGVFTQADALVLQGELNALLNAYRNDIGGDKYVVVVTVREDSVCMRTVTVSVSLNIPARITVYSAVDTYYTVGSMEQYVAADTISQIYAVADGDYITLFAPVAEGYTFLGWAEELSGGMQFVAEKTVYNASSVYYAIWGASKVGREVKAQINYSGSSLIAPDSGNGKWYDDSWNEVTTLSKQNTIVYTRTVFTLTVELKYKAFNQSMLHVGDKTAKASLTSGATLTAVIYEGTAQFTLSSNVLTVNDGVNVTEIYANEIKSSGSENTTNKRSIKSSLTGAVTVTSDISITLSY